MLSEKLKNLPENPGCYLMKNNKDKVIYVGKAKNLKNRVKSYFTGAHNKKTSLLVSEIVNFSYVLTNTELESLLLEINLIKQYQPKYNIKLLDDKSYPYLEITNEKYPRLVISRYKEVPKNKTLFGPYPGGYSLNKTLRLLQKLYPLRRCSLKETKPCLHYHINQCIGSCFDKTVNFNPNIKNITRFLKGDTKEVLGDLTFFMNQASSNCDYESAIEYRDMIDYVKETTQKQIIQLNDFKSKDFIGYYFNEEEIFIHILKYRQARILDTFSLCLNYLIDPLEALVNYLLLHYEKELVPDELVVSEQLGTFELEELLKTKVIIPKIKEKKKILELATLNAKEALDKKNLIYQSQSQTKQQAIDKLSEIVGKELYTLEVFDNAQLFGVAPVSTMIVYKNLKFEKKLYRKYHLKNAKQDDYEQFREVIYRRYHRLLLENNEFPDLILVDGGLGQLNACLQALKSLNLEIKVLGLKKNKNHQLESIVYNNQTIILEKGSLLYKLLGSISEEIHRFTLSFHKQIRSKTAQSSAFDQIIGFGPRRKRLLLKAFPTIDDLKNASLEQINNLGIPLNVAKKVKEVISEIYNNWYK